MSKIIYNLKIHFKSLDFKFAFKYTIIFILSYSFNWYLFGSKFALFNSFITTFYLMSPHVKTNIRTLSKLAFIITFIVFVAFLGYIANLNLVFSIILNFIFPFVLVCIFMTEANHSGHAYYYYLFIYAQIFNIDFIFCPTCFFSIIISVILGYLFEEVLFFKKQNIQTTEKISLKEYLIKSIGKNKGVLRNSLKLNTLVTSFAFRLAVITMIGFSLIKVLTLPSWTWAAFALCGPILPLIEESNKKSLRRIIGTVIGAVVFAICIFGIPFITIRWMIVLFSFILMFAYMKANKQTIFYVYSTFFVLFLSTLSSSPLNALIYRIAYSVIGGIIFIVINQILYKIIKLINLK